MQSTMNNMNNVYSGCGHCRNLKRSDWTNHKVSICPVLSETMCYSCKNKGHTSGYCPEKKKHIDKFENDFPVFIEHTNAVASEPLTKSWSQIAKKAMVNEDITESEELERKRKEALQEKKRKEREAYSARVEERRRRAEQDKINAEKGYTIYATHMRFLHGRNWFYYVCDVPVHYRDKVQQLIDEYDEECWRKEKEAEEEEKKYRELAEHNEATMTDEEYQNWVYDTTEEWIDEQFFHTSMIEYNLYKNEEQCERWLQEQLNNGTISCINGKI